MFLIFARQECVSFFNTTMTTIHESDDNSCSGEFDGVDRRILARPPNTCGAADPSTPDLRRSDNYIDATACEVVRGGGGKKTPASAFFTCNYGEKCVCHIHSSN